MSSVNELGESELFLSHRNFDENASLDENVGALEDVTILLRSSASAVRDNAIKYFLIVALYANASSGEIERAIEEFQGDNSGIALSMAATLSARLGDKKKQMLLLKEANNRNCPFAGMELGIYYEKKGKVATAMQWYKQSADFGNPLSQHKYALLCDIHRPRNLKGAATYYTMAMNNGNPRSMTHLRVMAEEGDLPPDCGPIGWSVTRMLHTACDLGCPLSKFRVIKELRNIIHSEERERILTICWEVYTEYPTADCAVFLCRMYIPFRGRPPEWGDPVKAIRLLEIAQELGYERGGTMLMKLRFKFGHQREQEPTMETLSNQAARRIFEFKKKMLKAIL